MSREELIQRIIDVLQADDRVRATWLGGSLGRGAGDRYSDVDLVAIVAEENRAGFVAEWDGIVATIASVVLTNRLSFPSSTVFSQVTADWLRFDVSVITPASLDRYTASTVRPLFDKDDHYSGLRQKREPLAPSGPRIQGLTKEFMRILGLLPVVLGREEYAVSDRGAHGRCPALPATGEGLVQPDRHAMAGCARKRAARPSGQPVGPEAVRLIPWRPTA